MRRGAAVGCWIAAVVLGAGTGHFLLPGHSTVQLPWLTPSGSKATPSASAEQMPTAYAKAPPTSRDLASLKTFKNAGITVTVYPQNGNTSPDSPATPCMDERTVGARTLGDVTGYDPLIFGTWDDTDSDGTADQSIVAADSPAAAKTATDRLLAAETTCQHEPAGHWVRGEIHQQLIEDGVWVAWLGDYEGKQNTTGEAPADEQPCGGVIFLRNGQRFSVLNVYLCADNQQLGEIAVGAAKRLG